MTIITIATPTGPLKVDTAFKMPSTLVEQIKGIIQAQDQITDKSQRRYVEAYDLVNKWAQQSNLEKNEGQKNEGQVFHYRIPNTNEDAGLGTGCWLKHADARRDFALVLAHNDAHVVFGLQIEPKTRLHAEKQA